MGLAYGIKFNMKLDGDLERAGKEAEERFYKVTQNLDVAYRVEAVRYAAHDPYATPYGGEDYITAPCLELFTFAIQRFTPKGFKIADQGMHSHNERWIPNDTSQKQWASLTPQEALKQFRIRRRMQIRILKKQLARAQEELALTEPKSEINFT